MLPIASKGGSIGDGGGGSSLALSIASTLSVSLSQEEIGSPQLDGWFASEKAKGSKGAFPDWCCDLALSADGGQIGPSNPGLVLSLRGSAAIEVRTSASLSLQVAHDEPKSRDIKRIYIHVCVCLRVFLLSAFPARLR